jgi:hypothetical protein
MDEKSDGHGLTPDGLLDPDVVFAEPIPGLVPVGRYAEPCVCPEYGDGPACPLCGIRHPFTVEAWGAGGPG